MKISQLIDRCQKGDSEALGILYANYAKPLRNVCKRFLSDKQAVDDVLHDSFVVILTSLDKLCDNSKAEEWMRAITRNVALKYNEYQKKHRIDSAEINEFIIDEPSTETKEFSMSELMGLVAQLPEGCAQIFRLAVFEGKSHDEIAALLNIEPHSSSSQLARAKRLLRKMIRQYWAVLLLLLIPISFFILREENAIGDEKTQLVVEPNETANESPVAPAQETVIAQNTESSEVIATTDTGQLIISCTNDSVATESLKTIAVQEETVSDSALLNQLQPAQNEEIPYYDIVDNYSSKPIHSAYKQKWSLGFAYLGNYSIMKNRESGFSLSDFMQEDEIVDIRKDITFPISYTISVHYRQNKRFGVESGASLSRQNYDIVKKNSFGMHYSQKSTIYYLGIPIKGILYLHTSKRCDLYGNFGLTMGIPIRSHGYSIPWLWSIGSGLGLQLNITRHIGVFTEPSVQYQILNRIEIYHLEHPFAFSLPVGLKIIW